MSSTLGTFSDVEYQTVFMAGLEHLQRDGTLTDFTLCAASTSIRCHKVVLAASSPYFLAMMTSGLKETTSHSVNMKATNPAILADIVHYIYTGNVHITTDNVEAFIQVSHQFQFPGLLKAGEDFMIHHLDPSNCIGFERFAQVYGLTELQKKAHECMVTRFREVIGGSMSTPESEFKEQDQDDLLVYINDKDLKIDSEDLVFHAVVTWVRHNPQSRQAKFLELLRHVKLPFCTLPYLQHVVCKEPLMSPTACQDILQEARMYHLLPEHRHEIVGHRGQPRPSFLVSRQLVVVGGLSTERENKYCWLMKNGSWEVVTQLPQPTWRFYHICQTKNTLIVTGGIDGSKVKKDCWLFDFVDKKWKTLPSMFEARFRHAAVQHGDCLYVVGGQDEEDRPLSSIEKLNMRSKSWAQVPAMQHGVWQPMVVSHGCSIYVFGGLDQQNDYLPHTQVLYSVMETWDLKSNMPETCQAGAAVCLGDSIYIVGGFVMSCLKYIPALDTWTMLSRPTMEHGNAPAVALNGHIVLGGGNWDETEEASALVEEYDPSTDTWSNWEHTLSEGLTCHYMCHLEV